MAITREQFSLLAAGLREAYPSSKFLNNEHAMQIWYSSLYDLDYPTLTEAVQRYIMTSSYPPTIASIREQAAARLVAKSEQGEQQAWGKVRKALRNSYYGAEKEFSLLPDDIRQAIGTPENLRAWGQMPESETETVLMSQFLRAYRTVKKREIDDLRLPDRLKLGSAPEPYEYIETKDPPQKMICAPPPDDLLKRI